MNLSRFLHTRIIQRIALDIRFQAATSISSQVSPERDVGVSRKTVSNRLHEISLFARNQQKKPVISKENIAARLALVSKHVLWPENRPSKVTKVNYYFWVRMETTICMDVSSRCTKPMDQFGGNSVESPIFMQDSSPCCKANSVMCYLMEQEFEIWTGWLKARTGIR